jgi:ribosome-binding factor A
MLTVVRVDLAGDGSHCKVYISSLLGEADAVQSVKGLRSAAGFVRRELFARLKMRKSPEIQFIADNSIAKGAEITRKLQSLAAEETEEQDAEA